MTEGRRMELRKTMGEANRRIREIMREQAVIEKQPEESKDLVKWLELQDEFDMIRLEVVNPAWIQWGVKQIEGLEADGVVLGVEDWSSWPSALVEEVASAVQAESDLSGQEKKPLSSPITSGGQEPPKAHFSTASSASEEGITEIETAPGISQIV
jgi:hypothetical protein